MPGCNAASSTLLSAVGAVGGKVVAADLELIAGHEPAVEFAYAVAEGCNQENVSMLMILRRRLGMAR